MPKTTEKTVLQAFKKRALIVKKKCWISLIITFRTMVFRLCCRLLINVKIKSGFKIFRLGGAFTVKILNFVDLFFWLQQNSIKNLF